MKVAALIVAAGSGTRLGLGPKAFVEVAGRSLLGRSAAALRPHVHEILVALPAGLSLPPDVPARAVIGGATRQESVLALLLATDADVVLVHDAARPFLPGAVVRAVIAAAAGMGAATAALPVADTLVRAVPGGDRAEADQNTGDRNPEDQSPGGETSGGRAAGGRASAGQGNFDWGHVTPRADLWAVQTPQGFRRPVLLGAHEAARRDGYAATDDAGLVARVGGAVRLVPGDARLFKVTTPGDLHLARALAPVWDAGA